MNTVANCFALAMAVTFASPQICEAGEEPSAGKRSFDPAWIVTPGRDGQVRRLAARTHQWKPKALEDLRGLDSLESLDLSGTVAGDDAMAALGRLSRLKTLLLAGTKVSDAGMAQIARLVELETLDLSDTQVSDEGLRQLRGLERLKWLVTHRSRVTEKGLEALESLRPGFEAVRLWDVTWEEFDHVLLLRTPRFNLIQDGFALQSGMATTGQIQLSGPPWKPALKSRVTFASPAGKKDRAPDVRIVCNMKADGSAPTVKIGDSTLELSNPARTYLIDGRGGIKPADFVLRYDFPSLMWLETRMKPSPSQGPSPSGPAAEPPAEGTSAQTAGPGTPGYASPPSANFIVTGGWNGKYVWGLADVEPRPNTFDPAGLPDSRRCERKSEGGLTVVFLHVPSYFAVEWGRGRSFGGLLLPGVGLQPMKDRSEVYERKCGVWKIGAFYAPGGVTPETRRFGAACLISVELLFGAGRRDTYWCPEVTPNPPNPRWPEIQRTQWKELMTWPELRIEKHGTELVVPVSRDRERKRLEVVDCLGRKHVLEEQRIDLSGPKKTIVLDLYGHLRVLSAADAQRILRTRLRDYLDNGDPSPAGPVAPVTPGQTKDKTNKRA